ncbi:endonuclease domain-containing protein [Asticcacaulis sp. AC460]|uniref:endonuclease domain-containing protein n=1 Tax=Asticcacaulis sp. AC460 TaxID=1282360 RepID=UPI0009DC9BA7|nr:DUF559 domain-containing protein [Asticcacaulis sp. AC460]
MKPKYAQARQMRRALTAPEYLLWERLKSRAPDMPIFRRQYPYGPYILDFYCVRAKLVIEVDGSHHHSDEAEHRDGVREAWLTAQGLEIYRVPAADVFRDVDGVADGIVLMASGKLGV